MQVVKRNGTKESVKFEKILKRIQRQSKDLKNIDPTEIAQKVIIGLFDGATTHQIDELAIETAYAASVKHPEYDKLATRLAVTALHKTTEPNFVAAMDKLQTNQDKLDRPQPILSDIVYKFIKKNAAILDATIDHSRDFLFDYFGFRTLSRAYLLKMNEQIIERPQYMWMRVACGIHYDDIDAAIQTYHLLSKMQATHATPTLYHSGTVQNQLLSCFLLSFTGDRDSMYDIYETLQNCALISKAAGGIGFHAHDIRSKNSIIYSTNGKSDGIVPMLRVFNETAKYSNQSGKRKGSFAVYLPDYHDDIFDFLDLRKNNGKEELRARDLFTAVWVSDLFMKTVESDGDWYLMDPNVSKGLSKVYDEREDGGSFTDLYNKYVEEGKFVRKIKARDLWQAILVSQMETGTPYLLAKDSINRKSNQKNIGVIESSNLCCEIVEYSSPEEIATCCLASVSLPSCVEGKKRKTFNFKKLEEITSIIVENLNKVIDVNSYPLEAAKLSSIKHRPIGIGQQGLADVFAMMRYPWESEEAKKLNQQISETMYYAAVKASCEFSKKFGSYSTFSGSPLSQGLFQFDLWNFKPSDRYDWNSLREDIMKYGVRNSLNTCILPSASTSQVLGNTEQVEVISSNLYKRQTLSGEFIQINKYLVDDLMELNLWNEEMKQRIIAENGSIQSIVEIPEDIKKLYKTVWEISQKIIVDFAADRAPFIDQSQSMNLYIKDINIAKLSSALFYAWKKGLKTLVYYTRNTASRETIKLVSDKKETETKELAEEIACSIDNREACEMCSA